MSGTNHLAGMPEFAKAFAEFQAELTKAGVSLKDEENVCRLFDIWLANYKDERVLSAQLNKEPWQD